jgi:L-alanine-DL-glutamate epimerase-like enolase superfamily enzyme
MIAHVATRLVTLPHVKSIVTPVEGDSFPHDAVDCAIVELTDTNGMTGTGLAWTTGAAKALVIKTMADSLAPFVIGSDAMLSEATYQRMWKHTNALGHAGVALIAMSAYDLAMWDLRGKLCQAPVYQLLGGAHTELDAYASGMFLSSPLDDVVAEAKGYEQAGFRSVKMRVGLPRLADDLERVEAVRAELGSSVGLMVDAGQAWDTAGAVRAVRALERFDLTWIEDPVPFDNIDGLIATRGITATPITAGEKLYSRYAFRELIERKAVDILMPDVQRVGGVTEWMRVAAMAEAWNLPIVGHAMPEINIHLMAATPHCLAVEYMSWWSRLFSGTLSVTSSGCLRVPSEPGFGIELKRDALDQFATAS